MDTKNQRSPIFEIEVKGERALFSDPLMRTGGGKFSYQVPTYEALKGVMKSIYWKPTIEWYIDEVRIMNPIDMEAMDAAFLKYKHTSSEAPRDLTYYTYLKDVCYHVKAHFEWNLLHPEMAGDRNMTKHVAITKRSIDAGGRLDPFIGARECPAEIRACAFDEGVGAYDKFDVLTFGIMLHGFTYADQAYSKETAGNITTRYWAPVMKNGVIKFIRPEETTMNRVMHPSEIRTFGKYDEKDTGDGRRMFVNDKEML